MSAPALVAKTNKTNEQAEAEVVPSSSLVEVEVWVEVEVGVEVGVGGVRVWLGLTFPVGWGWVGWWVVGDLESKANLNSSYS